MTVPKAPAFPKVLVTRPEPDAQDFADLCRQYDLRPVLSPVMAIRIYHEPVDMAGAGALAFTSANGVRAFAANCARRDLPVFAVGAATAKAAEAAGFCDIHTAGGEVVSLSEHIASKTSISSKGVLHIAGEVRAGDLVALLEEKGVPARRQALYSAVSAPALSGEAVAALEDDEAGLWVALFSPRTARLFVSLAEQSNVDGALAHVRAACLSQAVADAAAGAYSGQWAGLDVAPQQSAESLAAMIRAKAIA